MTQPIVNVRKKPRQMRSRFMVNVIVEAAVRVLLKRGYNGLTTREIAEVAGVSVGSLYQYFPNKQAILAEIVQRRADGIIAAVAQATEDTTSVGNIVPALINAYLAEKRRGVALSRALQAPMAILHGQKIIRDSAKRAQSLISRQLERSLGRPLSRDEEAGLAIAISSTEALISRAIADDPASLADAAFEQTLQRMFLAALNLPGSGAYSACAGKLAQA